MRFKTRGKLFKRRGQTLKQVAHPLDDPLCGQDWQGLEWTDWLFTRLSALRGPFGFKPARRSLLGSSANTSSPVPRQRLDERPSCGRNHPSCNQLSA